MPDTMDASTTADNMAPCFRANAGGFTCSRARWEEINAKLKFDTSSLFLKGDGSLTRLIETNLATLASARQARSAPAYLGAHGALAYSYPEVKEALVPQPAGDLPDVLDQVTKLFQGAPNWASPLTMTNVIPQANPAAMISSMIAQVFSANLVDGEYAWNVHIAELETAGMLGNLFGWDPLKAGSIYTFGGSGCLMYGLKYGLTRVLRNSRFNGVCVDAKLICSEQAHYAVQTAADWTGLGTENVVRIPTNSETHQMDVTHLERVLERLTSEGTPVATIICTVGTTDTGAFDSVGDIRRLLDRYPNPPGFGKAVLYADAVAGWAWAFFCKYDFQVNPLGFSECVLPLLRQNSQALGDLAYADAVGVDFHKVGWAPYVSSCFLYKDSEEFENLHSRKQASYLQERSPYNPMQYTLEVSRGAAGAVSGWATLKYLGMEGMQALLGGLLEKKVFLLNLLQQQRDMVCVNAGNTGLVTLFRAYPAGVDGERQFTNELTEPAFRGDLLKHNRIIELVAEKLYGWFRAEKLIDGRHTPYIGFSSGFRTTDYRRDEDGSDAMISALKIYPMNTSVTFESLRWTLCCVRLAVSEVSSAARAVDNGIVCAENGDRLVPASP